MHAAGTCLSAVYHPDTDTSNRNNITCAGSARVRPVLTSLPLQVLLYFGTWWSAIYWVITILIFIWKGEHL